MDNVLKGHGLGLACLSEQAAIEELDQERIFEHLAEGAHDALVFRAERWRLADHDHLVLARTTHDEHYLGLLAVSAEDTGQESFLSIDTAFIAPAARDLDLFQRMLAVAMLRIEGLDAVPAVVAACTGNPACIAALRDVAERCPGALLFPQADAVVQLGTVALACRIARQFAPRARFNAATGCVPGSREQVLVVLDLRACPPAMVVDAAAALCRARPSQAALRQAFGAPEPARRATGA